MCTRNWAPRNVLSTHSSKGSEQGDRVAAPQGQRAPYEYSRRTAVVRQHCSAVPWYGGFCQPHTSFPRWHQLLECHGAHGRHLPRARIARTGDAPQVNARLCFSRGRGAQCIERTPAPEFRRRVGRHLTMSAARMPRALRAAGGVRPSRATLRCRCEGTEASEAPKTAFSVTAHTAKGEKVFECDADEFILDAAEVRAASPPGSSGYSAARSESWPERLEYRQTGACPRSTWLHSAI